MQRFLSFLQSQAVIGGNFIKMITQAIQKLNLYSTNHLYVENQPITQVYFLLDGLACCTENIEGREIMTDFWEPMTFIIPKNVNKTMYSESVATVKLMQDSELIKIEIEDVRETLNYPEGRNLYNRFVNLEFQRQHRRNHFFRMHKVKDRIKYLDDHHPRLFNHLTHEQLASFIGTSRSNLTNLRAELLKRK